MRRIKKILLVLVTMILVFPSFLTKAATNEQSGEISSKDEVVYATLNAAGQTEEIYIVNTIDVVKEGEIIDYGPYTNVKNLTDLSKIEQNDETVNFTATEGKFYYQGNLNNESLPWNIIVTYYIDGKEISPEDLAGKDGHVQIKISISANDQVDQVFFENYLLQISLALDTELFTNIVAPDGMVANAGKNKQVTFTVMPEQEKEFMIEADAEGFELEGIDISGVPSTMAIDSPDVNEMTGDMKTLSDAISEMNKGVTKLNNGVSDLNKGVEALETGSKQYKTGISSLSGASADLVNGSKEIEIALKTVSESLGNTPEIDLSGLDQLIEGLGDLANGLKETANGLGTLKKNYKNAYGALDNAMQSIPSYDLTKEQLEALGNSGADKEVVGKLVETYSAARTAKETYTEVKKGLEAVDVTLQGVMDGLSEMNTHLNMMKKELSNSLTVMDDNSGFAQLQTGIITMASEYEEFHSGIVEYTNGVSQLATTYGNLHAGIVELSGGTRDLKAGVGELYEGTNELHESTKDLPDKMTEEIDQMISDFDKSDLNVISFVSNKNKNVNSVQFVLKTASIKIEEMNEQYESNEDEKGIWERFLDLFR